MAPKKDPKETPPRERKPKEDAVIKQRRQELVARLMVRGISAREIAETLGTPGKDGKIPLLNPETGLPYSEETIRLDMVAIKRAWKTSTKESVEQHRAQQLAELTEVKRTAWKANNLNTVLNALAHEAKLTDTAAPLRINISLVSDLWDALERAGHNPEVVIKAMLIELIGSGQK